MDGWETTLILRLVRFDPIGPFEIRKAAARERIATVDSCESKTSG